MIQERKCQACGGAVVAISKSPGAYRCENVTAGEVPTPPYPDDFIIVCNPDEAPLHISCVEDGIVWTRNEDGGRYEASNDSGRWLGSALITRPGMVPYDVSNPEDSLPRLGYQAKNGVWYKPFGGGMCIIREKVFEFCIPQLLTVAMDVLSNFGWKEVARAEREAFLSPVPLGDSRLELF